MSITGAFKTNRCSRHGYKIQGSRGCKRCVEEQDEAARAKEKTAPKPYTDHRLVTPKRTPISYVELIMELDGVTRIHLANNQQATEYVYGGSTEPYIVRCGPALIVEVGIINPLFKGELIFEVDDLKQVYDTLKLMPLCF